MNGSRTLTRTYCTPKSSQWNNNENRWHSVLRVKKSAANSEECYDSYVRTTLDKSTKHIYGLLVQIVRTLPCASECVLAHCRRIVRNHVVHRTCNGKKFETKISEIAGDRKRMEEMIQKIFRFVWAVWRARKHTLIRSNECRASSIQTCSSKMVSVLEHCGRMCAYTNWINR